MKTFYRQTSNYTSQTKNYTFFFIFNFTYVVSGIYRTSFQNLAISSYKNISINYKSMVYYETTLSVHTV